jgi:trimeric autotransporter adhesin
MSTMRRGARRSAYLFIAALGAASVSCGGGGDGGTGPGGGNGPTVTRVDMNPTSASVLVGKTSTLTATPKDVDGATVTGKSVAWSSSNTNVATVSSGVVTGVTPGTADIVAAVGSVQGKVTVTVMAPVATVEISPASPTIVIGGTSQLTATLKDASGNVLTDRTIEWKSDADLVASVSSSGLVTSKSVGSAHITATVEGKSASVTVAVTPVPVASVAITPPTSSLIVGGTVQLSATTKDDAGNVLTGRSIGWSSSDQTVATVDGNGFVTAKAVGSATITATSETKTATAAITVTVAPVATVAVAPSSVSILQGATTQLTATTSDASGRVLTDRTVTWSSSDQTKATVDQNGLVTGVSYGQVTITATSEEKTGSATVKVGDGTAPVLVGLTLTPNPVDVTSATKTVTATAHVTDAGGSGVAQFAITATAPHGAFADCVDTTRDSGTSSDGTWSCTLTIPIGAEPGDWKLLLLVSDAGFASRTYSTAELTAAALPATFNVVSNWDQAYPVFHSLTLTPATVNVANGAQTVTVSANLTDDRSGIARFDFLATSPSGRQVGCSAGAPSSGDMLNGTWTCAVSIPADAEAGTWNITVRATDRSFNYQTYGPQPNGGTIAFPAGYPTAITVTR